MIALSKLTNHHAIIHGHAVVTLELVYDLFLKVADIFWLDFVSETLYADCPILRLFDLLDHIFEVLILLEDLRFNILDLFAGLLDVFDLILYGLFADLSEDKHDL